MGKNGNSDDIIELGGNEFRRVKNGLDEDQVASFISELINQRDTLLQHEDHLTSLTKLAEKTVTEADRLAEEIKAEAREQSKAESATIIAKAEEQAQQRAEEKRSEIINSANDQAANIKSRAEQEAGLLLENKRKGVQSELSNFVHQLCSQLLSELEDFRQQIGALEVELEQKLFQSVGEHVTIDTGESTTVNTQEHSTADIVESTTVNTQEHSTADIGESTNVTTQEDEQIDKFLELLQTADQTDTTEPEWEVEVLPPIDIMKIMEFVTHLDSLPGISKTEIIPNADKPSILLYLSEPIDVIDVMRTLPEVAYINKDTIDNADTNGKLKKVQISISGKNMKDETNEIFNSEVSDILSDPS